MSYVLGYSEVERRRLAVQGLALNSMTEDLLRRSGIASGMRILDLGCGIGEVSLIAARLTGPAGHVTGIDLDRSYLDYAAARAAEAGFTNTTFLQSDLADHNPGAVYDAVIGRLILIHLKDPQAALRHLFSLLRPGGVIACHEVDMLPPNNYTLPLLRRLTSLVSDVARQILTHPRLGLELLAMFRAAGFINAETRIEIKLDDDPDTLLYEWVAALVRTLAPAMDSLGLATADDLDLDTIEDRLRHEALGSSEPHTWWPLVAAHARKP